MHTLKLYAPSFSYYGRIVRLLMQFKGLDYHLTTAPFGQEIGFFSEEHQLLHPFKKIPVLIDGDYVLTESMAMADYIESHAGPSLLPTGAKPRAHAIALASHINTDVHQHLVRNLILEFAFPKGPDKSIRFEYIEQHIDDARNTLDWIEKQLLENNPSHSNGVFFYHGQFTIADAYLLPALDYIDQLPSPYNLTTGYTRISAYLEFQRQQSYTQSVLGAADLAAA